MQGLQTHTVTLETVESFEQHEYPDQGAPQLKYREANHYTRACNMLHIDCANI